MTVSLPRALAVLVGAAATVATMAGIHAARDILGPLFLALVLAIVVQPMRAWLIRRMPSWLASTICIIAIYVLILGLGLALLVALARFASLLPTYKDDFADLMDDLTRWLHDIGVDEGDVAKISGSFDLSNLADVIGSTLASVASLASGLVFLLALCLFTAVDANQFPARLREEAAARPHLIGALNDFAAGTRRYLWVATIFGLIVAVLDTIALYLLDVPVPLVWGLLAFLTNYIPNIGFIIGLVPPAVLALLDSGPGLMLAVIAIYCALNLVIQTIIQPRVVGGEVGLSTTLTFLSLVFWSWIIGPVGAVLAVPLTLLAKALLVDADPGARWLIPLIANRADSSDVVRAAEPPAVGRVPDPR